MTKNSGVTLISLVITIIVMLILAGVSLNAVVGENGVLAQAESSNIYSKLSKYKESYELSIGSTEIDNWTHAEGDKGIRVSATGDDVKKYITNLDDDYLHRISIYNEQLLLSGNDLTEKEKTIAIDLGYVIMELEDYKYKFLMDKIEKLVKEHAIAGTIVGTPLTDAAPFQIAGINYGDDWYKIEASHLESLGFNSTEVTDLTPYAPFVVRYPNGETVSKIGKTMYVGTSQEIHKYTFNYYGDGLVILDLLAGVDNTSTRDLNTFGAFTRPSTASSYTFDEKGGVQMGHYGNNSIGELAIDQNVSINEEYSICLTVKCDTNQTGEYTSGYSPDGLPYHNKTIIAISDQSNEYVCWMGIEQNHLRVYSFRTNLTSISYQDLPKGFLSADVGEFTNQYMNIQFTAKKGEKARLYVNGELKTEEDAGDSDFTYKTLTIGDLRKGRNLRFEGTIYNVAIYGRVLTNAEIEQNYHASMVMVGD